MGIPIQNTYVYSFNFADDQVLLAQDNGGMEYMERKTKERIWKMGTGNKFRKNQVCILF